MQVYREFTAKTAFCIGETIRNIPKRIKEHKRDFKSGIFSNTLVIHNISKNHKFDFQYSNIIAFIHDKINVES